MLTFVLIYSGGGMPDTEEEAAVILKAWEAWYQILGNAVVDRGSPFLPLAKHIDSDGEVSDGPAGTLSSGYTILQAESLELAVGMAKGCPVLVSGGEVTIYETFPVS